MKAVNEGVQVVALFFSTKPQTRPTRRWPTVSADVYMADKSNNDFQSFKIVVFMNISIPKIRSTGYVGTAGFDAEIYPYSTKNSYSFLTIDCLPPPSAVLVDV